MTNFKTYLVTAIELDWDDELDEEGPIDDKIKKDIVSDCLGEWFDARNSKDEEYITAWCPRLIDCAG